MSQPTSHATVALPDWTLGTRQEPTLRVGIVLARDALRRMTATAETDLCATAGHAEPVAIPRGTPLAATTEPDAVELRFDGGRLRGRRIGLRPASDRPERATLRLHGVPAGRGFHWEKRIDASFLGAIELIADPGGMIVVNELPLEPYLAGVITAEMSERCPPEFLAAQCIVARSWLLARTEPKHDGEPFDRCNDDCCQRYQGTDAVSAAARTAAESTRGLVLMSPEGTVLDANYSKSCGGVSELPEFVWGHAKPGITAVCDAPKESPAAVPLPLSPTSLAAFITGDMPGLETCYCSPRTVGREALAQFLGRVDEVTDYFRWEVRVTHDELLASVRACVPQAASLDRIVALRPLRRGVSGRIAEMEIDGADVGGNALVVRLESEYAIRRALHARFLFSAALLVRPEHDGARLRAVTFLGAGWGHGVGFCQIGALGMALGGHDAAAICRHYFPAAGLAPAYGIGGKSSS